MRKLFGVGMGLAALLAAFPAQAEVVPGSGEFHIYGGFVLGDDVADAISGTEPELDDDMVWGLRLGGTFSPHWGFEASAGWSPNQIDNLPSSGETDADVGFFDFSAVNYLNPDYRHVAYVVWGIGWATADLEDEVYLEDQDGFTLHAGVGARFFPTDDFIVRIEGRYRYVDKLVDPVGPEDGDHLNLFEGTVGLGWRWGGY